MPRRLIEGTASEADCPALQCPLGYDLLQIARWPMRSYRLALCSLAMLPLLGVAALAQEPLKPEELTVETIPPGTPKLFIADLAITHIVDGKLYVHNAEDMKYLGTIGTGFTGQIY